MTPYVPEPKSWVNKTSRPFQSKQFGPDVRFDTDDQSISIHITRDLSAREVAMLPKHGFDLEQEGSGIWIASLAEMRRVGGDRSVVAHQLIDRPDTGTSR